VIVGFAAETNPDLDAARAKLARKGCDLLVVNQVGDGLAFGTADNEAVVLGADGTEVSLPRGPRAAPVSVSTMGSVAASDTTARPRRARRAVACACASAWALATAF